MQTRSTFALFATLLFVGCANEAGDLAVINSSEPGSTEEAGRAIREADIIQLEGDRLYAMSESGTLSVVDVSSPEQLALLGQVVLPGRPFEMYRRGAYLITMSNQALNVSGALQYGPAATPEDAGALVMAVDVRDPAQMEMSGSLQVPGEIADSRVVGDVLYLATYENTACFGCGGEPRTLVTSFDLSNPLATRIIDQLSFESSAPDGYNLAWGSDWKRSIYVTPERLYIGGHADLGPGSYYEASGPEGIIDVIDIRDPSGRMTQGARLVVAGAILSRWQLDERDGILRVVSQIGAGRTGNGLAEPEVATFRIYDTDTFVPLGKANIQLPRQEGLRSVRFDGDRAYAITYNQTDPLFVLDLSDPEHPRQRGELFMPGFVFHLEPHQDRVLGLGIDRDDPEGSLNVSLFDVSDPDHPKMIERVGFGQPNPWEDYEILNGELAEDQDRIQKAFRVLDDGLVVVPFSGLTGDGCSGGGVQLIQWSDDTLTRRALLPVPGRPRRALLHREALLAVSDSHVRAFALDTLDEAQQTSELEVGQCVPRDVQYGYDYGYFDESSHGFFGVYGCSTGVGPSGAGSLGLLLGLLMVARRRRSLPREP